MPMETKDDVGVRDSGRPGPELAGLRILRDRNPSAVPESWQMAEDFLVLAAALRPDLRIDVQSFGGTAVVCFEGPGTSAQFEFLPNGAIAANIDVGGAELDLDVEGFDGSELPEEIARHLVR